MSSNELCKACTLLEGLERGMANSGIVSHLRLIYFTNTIHYDPLSRLTGHARNLRQKAQPQIIYGRYRTLTLRQGTQLSPSKHRHHSDSRGGSTPLLTFNLQTRHASRLNFVGPLSFMHNNEYRALSVAPMLQRRSLYRLELYFILHLVVDYRLPLIHCLYPKCFQECSGA